MLRTNRSLRQNDLPDPRGAPSIRMTYQTNLPVQRRLLLGAVLFAILLVFGYVAMVTTSRGHQLDDDAYFGRKAVSRKVVSLDYRLLDHVTKATLLVAALILLIIAAVRRCTLVGVIAVVAFGCAVIGAEFFKHTLPWRALVPDDRLLEKFLKRESYPSGHASVGTSLALSLILVSPSYWRPWLAVAAGFMSATFATGVLFAGWHRPSDALGALAWSGFCMTVAAILAVRLRGRPRPVTVHPGPALFSSLVLGILVAGGTWLIAGVAAPEYPFGDLPFFVFTGLIIAGAFSLLAWYGWELRAIDWPDDSAAGA
jgi:membrane-associated phospholipid phosphatase